jgi:glycosyltransferase involved in cell wall biosynthesis
MTTISAVVLSYNKAHIFPEFVASLHRQTRKPDQVIVVDDASTDGMGEMLGRLCNGWHTIKLSVNRGQSYARNLGFERVKGDYTIFLDGDLEMKPEMLQVMEEKLNSNPGASFAYCHYERVGSRVDRLSAKPWDLTALRDMNYISMVSLVRTKDLPRPPLDEALRRYEDWDLWLTMAEKGKTGILVDQVLFRAHYRPEDLSGSGESGGWYSRVKEKHGLG